MSTASGTYPASKEVAAALPSAAVDDAEEPNHHGGSGFEWESDSHTQDNQIPNICKGQILGKSAISFVGSQGVNRETEVKILSISIQSPGRPDIVLPINDRVSVNSSRNSLFSLNEGSSCRTSFSFLVSNGAVPGLKHTYTVWKTGIRVRNTKILIGSFGPREEAYIHELPPDEMIPCGFWARGSYFVRIKFVDEEGRCYMDFSYYFEIRKK